MEKINPHRAERHAWRRHCALSCNLDRNENTHTHTLTHTFEFRSNDGSLQFLIKSHSSGFEKASRIRSTEPAEPHYYPVPTTLYKRRGDKCRVNVKRAEDEEWPFFNRRLWKGLPVGAALYVFSTSYFFPSPCGWRGGHPYCKFEMSLVFIVSNF